MGIFNRNIYCSSPACSSFSRGLQLNHDIYAGMRKAGRLILAEVTHARSSDFLHCHISQLPPLLQLFPYTPTALLSHQLMSVTQRFHAWHQTGSMDFIYTLWNNKAICSIRFGRSFLSDTVGMKRKLLIIMVWVFLFVFFLLTELEDFLLTIDALPFI